MITFLIIYIVTIIFIWYDGWRYMNEEGYGDDYPLRLVDVIKSTNWITYIPVVNTIVVILVAIESLVDSLYKDKSE